MTDKNSGGLRNLNNCDFETAYLKINMVIAEDTKQTIVRGKVSIPDSKPDVEKILSIEKYAKVKKVEVLPDKVVVNGILSLQVVYVVFKPDNKDYKMHHKDHKHMNNEDHMHHADHHSMHHGVHWMHHELPFTAFIDLPGVQPGMDVSVKPTVEDVSMTPAADCARDFDIAAVLSLAAKVTEPREVNVAVKAQPGNQVETERLKVEHLIGSAKKQIIVMDTFKIPNEKPDVQEVLNIDSEVTITNKRIIKDKVIFDGEIDLSILYVAMKPDMPVHELHKIIKFSDFVEVPGAEKDMNVDINAIVEKGNLEPTAGDACKLDVDMVLALNVYVTESRTVDVITDIDSDDCEVTKTTLKVDHLVGEATTQVIVRDTSAPPEGDPDCDKVLDCRLEKIEVKDVDILNGKVIVRGTVEIIVVYMGMNNEHSLHIMRRKLNFRTFVEIPGAKEYMDVMVKPVVEYLNGEPEGINVHCEAVLKITVRVTESINRDVVISLEPKETPMPTMPPPEEPICKPGEVITYTVRAGDTFFKLAQQYGVSLQAIIDANPDINPNNLKVGDVIKIPCVPKG